MASFDGISIAGIKFSYGSSAVCPSLIWKSKSVKFNWCLHGTVSTKSIFKYESNYYRVWNERLAWNCITFSTSLRTRWKFNPANFFNSCGSHFNPPFSGFANLSNKVGYVELSSRFFMTPLKSRKFRNHLHRHSGKLKKVSRIHRKIKFQTNFIITCLPS